MSQSKRTRKPWRRYTDWDIEKWVLDNIDERSDTYERTNLEMDEVRCTFWMRCYHAKEFDGPYRDDEIFVLYMKAVRPTWSFNGHKVDTSVQVVLDTYQGWSVSHDAPEWTRWKEGKEFGFVQNLSEFIEPVMKIITEVGDKFCQYRCRVGKQSSGANT
ncbi:hypothetical protein WOLCODRAFT_136512 [Wolfiporia cocos MD-104 SS10]|uniref:Uncharacterized protein n=1 Tax=Wolfiporia cocos (strain MD-104) TaxID=742152 RepID=A0A2H3JIX3_WOLCO|nr:hypothetical protein WOLCODRAFT_136512 [Wolfiporia cocos MD-104 SS10]